MSWVIYKGRPRFTAAKRQRQLQAAVEPLKTDEVFEDVVGYDQVEMFRPEIFKDDWLHTTESRRDSRAEDSTNQNDLLSLESLTSDEIFPQHLDMIKSEEEEIISTTFPWWLSGKEIVVEDKAAKELLCETFTLKDQNPLAKVHNKSSRKRKADQISNHCHPPVSGKEVADWITQSMQRNILSRQPSLYSLLRAWVVMQKEPRHQELCVPRRPSLLEYAERAARNSTEEESHEQPYSWSALATVDNSPLIDILEWFKTPLLNGWKPYVYSQGEQLINWQARSDRNFLQRALHKNNMREAKKLLTRKGIDLQQHPVAIKLGQKRKPGRPKKNSSSRK